MLIGIISDTHGYLDPRLAQAFAGVEAILHAGDVGATRVLDALREVAPVYAVRGNNDDKLGGLGLPAHVDVELAGVSFHVVHQLPHARPRDHTRVVVYGHSHKAVIEHRDGRMYVNPGAAGRAGFHRVESVALLTADAGEVVDARIVELGPRLALPARSRRAG